MSFPWDGDPLTLPFKVSIVLLEQVTHRYGAIHATVIILQRWNVIVVFVVTVKPVCALYSRVTFVQVCNL